MSEPNVRLPSQDIVLPSPPREIPTPHQFAAILLRLFRPADGVCACDKCKALREATLSYEQLYMARMPILDEWKRACKDIETLRAGNADVALTRALNAADEALEKWGKSAVGDEVERGEELAAALHAIIGMLPPRDGTIT